MRAGAVARLGRALALTAAACGSQGGNTRANDAEAPDFPEADIVAYVDAGCGATQTDPHNCGGCGVDCEGGACVEGVCSSPPPGVLASGQDTPVGIALDDANVYWMNRGVLSGGSQLMKCAKTGCGEAPTVLASGAWSDSTRLALYGGIVYWAAPNRVLSCPTDGCPRGPTVLSSGPLQPTDIAVGAAGVYVGDAMQHALLVYPLIGGAGPTVLWSSPAAPTAIALGGSTVYFGTMGVSLLSCGAPPCPTLVSGGTPSALDVAGTNIYIGTTQASTAPGAVASCPEANCAAGLTLLTTQVTDCVGIAADETGVYFTDRGSLNGSAGAPALGRVAKCPLAGCPGKPTPVAAYLNFPQQIAVDSTTVYWTDFGSGTVSTGTLDGRVMTASK